MSVLAKRTPVLLGAVLLLSCAGGCTMKKGPDPRMEAAISKAESAANRAEMAANSAAEAAKRADAAAQRVEAITTHPVGMKGEMMHEHAHHKHHGKKSK